MDKIEPKKFWECSVCGKEFAPEGPAYYLNCPTCRNSGFPDMTWKQYQGALTRLYDRITDGLKLIFWDDNTIGNKDTQCSWGLCTREPEQWPDPEIHVWPHSFVTEGRIAPRRRQEGQYCPFDRRAWEEDQDDSYTFGCFYRCMFFNPEGHSRPNREQAKALILTLIGRIRDGKD